MKRLFIWAVLMMVALAGAQSVDAIETLMDQGKFQEAFEAGNRSNNAAGFILGARSAAYYAGYQATDNQKADWFNRAETLARRAIQTDSENPAAYFELARAQGRLAQYKGILDSLSLAQSIKEALEKTLKLNPRHAGAKGALALWNYNLVSKNVGWLYGANGNSVVPLFQEAIALEPQTIIHRVEFAGVLAAQNRKDEARRQYEAALAIAPKTAADRLDLERAKRELAALR